MFLLSAPFLVCGVFVLYVDPFNYFGVFDGIPVIKKQEIIYRDDRLLWNVIGYAKTPSPNIIIGDSRADCFSSEHLKEKTGEQYRHLSASACKINEIADLFWFANSHAKLENVYVVLNFNMFNHYAFADRVAGAEALIKNPLLYVYNRHVIGTAYSIFKSVFTTGKALALKPPSSKNDFWAWSLNQWSNQQYGKWKYPVSGYDKLRQMADYCRKEKINLIFIIAPHHVDYQKKVSQFNLSDEFIQFKKDISSLSTTYDFDLINDLTNNKENFTDPVHMTVEVGNIVIDEVVSGKLHYGRLLEVE
jgi:hypothetical protein